MVTSRINPPSEATNNPNEGFQVAFAKPAPTNRIIATISARAPAIDISSAVEPSDSSTSASPASSTASKNPPVTYAVQPVIKRKTAAISPSLVSRI